MSSDATDCHSRQEEQELEKCEEQGIIEHVERLICCVSPMVTFPKPRNSDQSRLCVDLRHPNKAVKRHHHPTPTVDEVTNELIGACTCIFQT